MNGSRGICRLSNKAAQMSNALRNTTCSLWAGGRLDGPAGLIQQAGCPLAPQAGSLCYVIQMKNFWLVKQEPSSYSWSDFVAEGKTSWTGVRNFAARNNLRNMRPGDEVLFYHSGDEKAVVGIAKVTRTAYPDRTANEGDWSTVDLAAVKPLARPLTLREIKANSRLKGIPLVRQSRLSVMPLGQPEFREIVKMSRR
jgi:predicted RNA-binding protein with PUA-like domain